jgi:hypothetical protein
MKFLVSFLILLAAASSSSAQLVSGQSGKFLIQVGTQNQQGIYALCGLLNQYQTSNGIEWRWQEPCSQILRLFNPPAVTPTPPLQTPRPPVQPTTVAPRFNCQDGTFRKVAPNQLDFGPTTLQEGVDTYLCFDVPENTGRSFIEINSTNLSNASCSSVDIRVTGPNGATCSGVGTQPGCSAAPLTPGRWSAVYRLNWGCDRYRFTVRW